MSATERLGRRARALRGLHTVIAAAELASLVHVWACALSGRRDRALPVSITALSLEGVGLLIGRGDCPLAPLQRQVGDPVPLFELALPPRAAKAAVPVLAAVAVGGMVTLALRSTGVRSVLNLRGGADRTRSALAAHAARARED
ncbi:hypothetical protein L0U85_06875 [Glycomyces sp. L485]|uniref:hypothetical protein n=1 Tax=Glycomyces sp. L485 TaxID=2909235 RepID=UPI001F4B4D05|nr:hypothetical protein [Glycomyces sp. L485]MCH7230577.1 hypothetical protein [Glycomyces sp. L485]